jgi:predicted ATPase
MAQVTMGATYYWRGEFSKAREVHEAAIRRYHPEDHRGHEYLWGSQSPEVSALFYVSWSLLSLGYPDQARTRSREALALAQELSHPFSQAFALLAAHRVHMVRGEYQAAAEEGEALITLASEHGFPFYVGAGTFLRASARAAQGQPQRIGEMRAVLEVLWTTGVKMGSPMMLATLAEAHRKAGQVEEGLAAVAEALEFVRKTGERDAEAELHRVKGELLLARSPSDQAAAETSFHQAIDIARRQSAKSFELRAATSLARFWLSQGRKDEARELLAPVYDWFTEGFDTRDLKDAKALLDELAS